NDYLYTFRSMVFKSHADFVYLVSKSCRRLPLMVNVWRGTALLLAFTASSMGAEVCSATAGDATEAASQETRTLKVATIPISEQIFTTSLLPGEKETSGIDGHAAHSSTVIPFIPRTASLSKQLRVITGLIERNRAGGIQSFKLSVNDARWKTPLQADMRVEEILMQYGLQPVPTPATGNCQYYAVAMSLLDLHFDTPQHVEALEQMTQQLKGGIEEAIRHGYDVEFPHDIRQAILVSTQLEADQQDHTIPETEEESDLLFLKLFQGIAESPSGTSAFVPTEFWGTEVTLRMMAKLLQQSIFVVNAPYGLQTHVDYLVYKAEQVTKDGYELNSAEQHFITRSNIKLWLRQLQQACEDSSSLTNPPIVLLFSNFHYSRLQFVELTNVENDRSEL
ncbi:hypothetical protein F442_18193, partial [Phytophthora nicotianae P10297]